MCQGPLLLCRCCCYALVQFRSTVTFPVKDLVQVSLSMLRETATASLFFLTPFLFSSYFLRFKFIFHNEFTLFLFFPSLLTVPVRHGFRPTPRSHEGIPRDTVPQDAITGVSHYTHHFLGPLLPFVRAPGTK